MHTISVLLTRQKDRASRVLYWVTGRAYTHASIRLDELGDEFYSFNFKGLCTEQPYRFDEKHTMKSILYRLEVSDSVFKKLHTKLNTMLKNRSVYHYDGFGVVLCLLHIPHRFTNAYFCSQFVAELLKNTGAVSLSNHPSTCLPNTLEKTLRTAKNTVQAVLDPFRLPSKSVKDGMSVLPMSNTATSPISCLG